MALSEDEVERLLQEDERDKKFARPKYVSKTMRTPVEQMGRMAKREYTKAGEVFITMIAPTYDELFDDAVPFEARKAKFIKFADTKKNKVEVALAMNVSMYRINELLKYFSLTRKRVKPLERGARTAQLHPLVVEAAQRLDPTPRPIPWPVPWHTGWSGVAEAEEVESNLEKAKKMLDPGKRYRVTISLEEIV